MNRHKHQIWYLFWPMLILSMVSPNLLHSQEKMDGKDGMEDIVILVAVDPLQKIFKENAFFEEVDPIADVARGEHASFQFVIRSNSSIKTSEQPFDS